MECFCCNCDAEHLIAGQHLHLHRDVSKLKVKRIPRKYIDQITIIYLYKISFGKSKKEIIYLSRNRYVIIDFAKHMK